MRGPSAGIPGYGLLGGTVLLLLVIPIVIIFAMAWGYWPPFQSVGLEVRIESPAIPMDEFQEDRVVVSVRCAQGRTVAASGPKLFLNSRPVGWNHLGNALRVELSRRPDPVVYVEGESGLTFADIVRVVDIARGAWYGVPVVLVTPTLDRGLDAQRAGFRAVRSHKPLRAAQQPAR